MKSSGRVLREKRFRLSDITEEQVLQLMESIDTDEDDGDFSSDDEFNDPDFILDEISPEDEQCISICVREMHANGSKNIADQTFDMSLISTSSATDAVPSTSAIEDFPSTSATEDVPSTSAASLKLQKRARSPLPLVENFGPSNKPSDGGFNGAGICYVHLVSNSQTYSFSALNEIYKDSKEFSNITWRKRQIQLHVNDVAFQGDSGLPPSIKELLTPMDFFNYFFSEKIIQLIAEETNRTAYMENINTNFKTHPEEIRHYIGILMYMSLYRYPKLESYWGKNAFPMIQNTMPVKKFMTIKKYLSFQDESQRIKRGQPGYDPLFRIRGLADEINKMFDTIPKTSRLCVDEQMCSTKIRHHLRQYMPNKPHKWGIKLFVLCDSNGFAYRFEIFIGAGDNVILPDTPDLGSTANVVVRLSQTIPSFKNHILYFDNFYTTLPLLVYLRARGIFSLGTIRVNRIPMCKLPSDHDIKDQQRGFSVEYVASPYGVDINTVLWKDNRSVRLASTYVGTKPFMRSNPSHQEAKVARYDRKQKKYLEVDCPQIIREYNRHMGGVDLMDGLMGRYHIRAKTRNPMIRLFYHLIDMAATNSYILYRRALSEKSNDSSCNTTEETTLQLPQFREEIAAGLVSYREKRPPGREANTPQRSVIQASTFGIGKRSKHPVGDIRYDNYDHFPVWLEREGGKKKCKFCKSSQTQCICQKCKLNLCCSSSKNCFFDYHHRK